MKFFILGTFSLLCFSGCHSPLPTELQTMMPTESQGSQTQRHEQWQRVFGGPNYDDAFDVCPTPAGDYLLVGTTFSIGAGKSDALVMRIDSQGEVLWQKTYGGPDYDDAHDLQPTQDGGFVFTGFTYSQGAGKSDVWVVKINQAGQQEWALTFGGKQRDRAYSLQATRDQGAILAGYTSSKGAGANDAWIIKVNHQGQLEWEQTYGGRASDQARSIIELRAGGYLFAGVTASQTAGGNDMWVVKINEQGHLIWERRYGGQQHDEALMIKEAPDGSYLLAGSTSSAGAGTQDAWILKLHSDGQRQWDRTFGELRAEQANAVSLTEDGGVIFTGYQYPLDSGKNDLWLVKLNAQGDMEWQQQFGGAAWDNAFAIQQTQDRGYMVVGSTSSLGFGKSDIWVLKLNHTGE